MSSYIQALGAHVASLAILAMILASLELTLSSGSATLAIRCCVNLARDSLCFAAHASTPLFMWPHAGDHVLAGMHGRANVAPALHASVLGHRGCHSLLCSLALQQTAR